MSLKNKLLLSMLMLFTAQAFAGSMPQQSAVPGGVVIIPLSGQQAPKPVVQFQNKPVMVVKSAGYWQAVLGVPLDLKPGTHRVSVSQGKEKSTTIFEIKDKQYPTQHISIKDKSKVNPNHYDMQRINGETARIDAALQHWTDKETIPFNFIWPVKGRVSGLFGRRRVFNGEPRKPHSGMDIAAAKGTVIQAPAEGIVRGIGNYFFNGNTVFIDHGQGLVTLFCHLDTISVRDGQNLKQGETIGTVGATGRVTGPHLHLGVSLNDQRVEPRLFFPSKAALEQ